jgi:hypothetical protein
VATATRLKVVGPDRLPPHNLQVEQGLIGSLLRDPAAIPAVAGFLAVEDFYRSTHQVLYHTILRLQAEGRPCDSLSLLDELERRGDLERAGGEQTIREAMEAAPHSANATYYAEIVHQRAVARGVIESCNVLLKAAYADDRPVDELVDLAEAQVKDLGARLTARTSRARAEMVCLADVDAEAVRWLWPGRIALGKLTLLVGDPGLGKSFVTCAIAATVSAGGCWPDLAGEHIEPGQVVMLSAEDGLADTIRPRLDAAGADCQRIHALTTIRGRDGRLRPFKIFDGLPLLEEALDALGDVRLVVIDPVSAYLGGTADEHKNAEVRSLLTPLTELATRRGVAMLLVTHLNKGSGTTKAIYRATGSLAFIAAARQAWLFARDSDDPTGLRRLVLPAKSNIVAEPSGLAYRLVDGAVQWDAVPVCMHADEALERDSGRRERTRGPAPIKTQAAKDWILEQLGSSPAGVRHGELRREAEHAGHKTSTFYDALDSLRAEGLAEELEVDGRKWLKLTRPEGDDGEGRDRAVF